MKVFETILQSVITKLQPLNIPVLSVVGDNPAYPYIAVEFVSMMDTKESKTNFIWYGTFNLVCDFKISQSIKEATDIEESIFVLLKPYMTATLFESMSQFDLFDRTGVFEVTDTEKVYRMIYSWEYKICEPKDYYTRVTLNGGTVEAVECTIITN